MSTRNRVDGRSEHFQRDRAGIVLGPADKTVHIEVISLEEVARELRARLRRARGHPIAHEYELDTKQLRTMEEM
jgi:hypothetical protein